MTAQPEGKGQTQSTTTTTVKMILGLLSAGLLLTLAAAVVAVVINQQQVSELKETIHDLPKMTHEIQTMLSLAMMNKSEVTESPRATPPSVTCEPSDVDDLGNKISCAAIHARHPGKASGVQFIFPGGCAPGRKVWCDMDTEGGGWTRFQSRYDGSVSFNNSLEVYQHGFGHPQGEFWIGNEDLHRLTTDQPSELRIDILDWDGIHGYAKYFSFSVDSVSSKYALHVAGYSGIIGDALMVEHNSKPFSTTDRISDCKTPSYGGGGWWYGSNCHSANLNGGYYAGGVNHYKGVNWLDWRNNYYSYKATSMLTRPRL